MKTDEVPQLQAPGQGLPFLQKLFVRYWLGPIVSKKTPIYESRKTYEILTQKLIENIKKISEPERKIKILVKPIPGLEDSSRYWSLNGVLEHLMIVSKGMEAVILSLSAGQVPNTKVDIAKLKPKNFEKDILTEFIEYAPNLMKNIDQKVSVPGFDFQSSLKFYHPWMGQITAKQWYWLLSSHQAIHYQQAKEIIKSLSENKI